MLPHLRPNTAYFADCRMTRFEASRPLPSQEGNCRSRAVTDSSKIACDWLAFRRGRCYTCGADCTPAGEAAPRPE
jgi:hypothetical protein